MWWCITVLALGRWRQETRWHRHHRHCPHSHTHTQTDRRAGRQTLLILILWKALTNAGWGWGWSCTKILPEFSCSLGSFLNLILCTLLGRTIIPISQLRKVNAQELRVSLKLHSWHTAKQEAGLSDPRPHFTDAWYLRDIESKKKKNLFLERTKVRQISRETNRKKRYKQNAEWKEELITDMVEL